MTNAVRRVSLLAAVLVVLHALSWDAVRWDGDGFIANSEDLVGIGAAKANLFRVSLLLDMFGSYLLTIPATLGLRQLLRRDANTRTVDALASAGVAFALVGAAAAAYFAIVGAHAIRAHDADTFTHANTVALVAWQIIGLSCAGVWWLGSGRLLHGRPGWTWFSRYSMVVGAGFVLVALVRVAGVELNSPTPATPAFLPIAVWVGWLGLRLARDASTPERR